jgi:hypothetical protein
MIISAVVFFLGAIFILSRQANYLTRWDLGFYLVAFHLMVIGALFWVGLLAFGDLSGHLSLILGFLALIFGSFWLLLGFTRFESKFLNEGIAKSTIHAVESFILKWIFGIVLIVQGFLSLLRGF